MEGSINNELTTVLKSYWKKDELNLKANWSRRHFRCVP